MREAVSVWDLLPTLRGEDEGLREQTRGVGELLSARFERRGLGVVLGAVGELTTRALYERLHLS
jgi:hypothetical protein